MSEQMTVLVVDDDPEIVKLYRRSLGSCGYRLVSTCDPVEAATILLSDPVDVLLSDIDMPRLTGHELVALAREVRPEAVRILVTGAATMESAVRAINEGEVHRFVKKPFELNELRSIVVQAAARRHELGVASEAGRRARRRERLRAQLEAEHPGITTVVRGADGVYEVDPRGVRVAAAAIGLAGVLRT
jgi:two-component system, probable response regulator PhcQ